jgi:hypothetical protein
MAAAILFLYGTLLTRDGVINAGRKKRYAWFCDAVE